MDGNLVRNAAFADALVDWVPAWRCVGTGNIDKILLHVTGGSLWGSLLAAKLTAASALTGSARRTNFSWAQQMEKRDWNVPCLLLRWSRCLLCWCSFLRWQEDLGGGEENLGESIDFGNFWFLIPEQQLLMLLSFTVYLQSIEGISFAEGLCLPAQCRWWVPKHEGSLGPAKSLMFLTELPVSPDLNPIKHPWDITYCRIHCCHHTTATPAQAVQELTDVLIHVWEEIPRETISRLIRSVPGRGERVQAGRRPHTLLSYIMSGLDWIHGCVISLWSHLV